MPLQQPVHTDARQALKLLHKLLTNDGRAQLIKRLVATEYRNCGSFPANLSAFLVMRAASIGVVLSNVHVEFALGFDVLSDLPPNRDLRRLIDALGYNAALDVALVNDLQSVPKEIKIGDFMNVVPYLYVQDRCGGKCGGEKEEALVLEEKVQAALGMLKDCKVETRRVEEEIEARAAEIRRYVRGIADLVAGMDRWHMEALRYAVTT